ncbi:MAG: hydroxysqualene dehydroxylase HpnE [Acidimicrobiales bacterium]
MTGGQARVLERPLARGAAEGAVAPPPEGARIAVVGGGLAGTAAALACADAGAKVTLLEKRARLGGLTWSFSHEGLTMDNGQHVFLRCCTAYLEFLDRIGSAGDVCLQERLDLTVLRPRTSQSPGAGPERATLRRDRARAPFHLARCLLGYRMLPPGPRALLGPAALALSRLDLDDPDLDNQTFAAWLARHHQGPAAVAALWDLICLPTVNLRAQEASLAMAAKVFQTGLLRDCAGGDIGWSRVPLGQLHGERSARALHKAGVAVHLGDAARRVERWPVRGAGEGAPRGLVIRTSGGELEADGVIVALPHYCTEEVLPAGVLGAARPSALASSPIVNVHVHFDRQVMAVPLAAGLGTLAQWVFDRTSSSGAGRGQYLAVSISAADGCIGARPDELGQQVVAALRLLFPRARQAEVLSTFVTREHHATFRALPGSARHRSAPRTGLPGLAVAGAWTSTGWPPTMEGAVRSGLAAARAVLVATGQRRWLPALPGAA